MADYRPPEPRSYDDLDDDYRFALAVLNVADQELAAHGARLEPANARYLIRHVLIRAGLLDHTDPVS